MWSENAKKQIRKGALWAGTTQNRCLGQTLTKFQNAIKPIADFWILFVTWDVISILALLTTGNIARSGK